MPVALIDGDIIAYRASSVLCPDPWNPDAPKVPLSEFWAIKTALSMVASWQEMAECERSVVCLTGARNFRNRVLPSYKMNRVPTERPATLAAVKAALAQIPDAQLVEGLEADDLMGIMMTNGRCPGAVCVTIDKDLRTIPGNHLNPVTTQAIEVVTEAEGNMKWLTQTLTGDKVDGYDGCPGIGPKKAETILLGTHGVVSAAWPLVVKAFGEVSTNRLALKGLGPLTEHDALVQARVARILRAEDYDKNTKEVILWHPTAPVRIPVDIQERTS